MMHRTRRSFCVSFVLVVCFASANPKLEVASAAEENKWDAYRPISPPFARPAASALRNSRGRWA